MPNIPGLRSPYIKVGSLVYFGRMIDKIRLHAAGRLPVEDYVPNLGKGFDARCCGFLHIGYDALKARVLDPAAPAGETDILAWVEGIGGRRTEGEIELWNSFMMKRGFRDDAAPVLARRIKESGLEDKPIMTMFDYIDFDEGRDPVTVSAWG